MRLRYPELALAYQKETGKSASVDGLWMDARIGVMNGNIIIEKDSCPESFINEVAQRGGCSIPDMDYVAWLEEQLILNKIF